MPIVFNILKRDATPKSSLEQGSILSAYLLNVRLTERQTAAITEAFRAHFGPGARLVLFGSRVDDAKRGGDIDLCVETDQLPWEDLVRARHAFLVALGKMLGERKIDVVLRRREDESRLIDREVDEKGVELCQISY